MMALAAVVAQPPADPRLSRMTALYDQVCLQAFPDDGAVEKLMIAAGARELSPDEVKVTMRDDPARGWDLEGGSASVWIEFPPFHACSVRWNAPAVGDLVAYRAAIASYKRTRSGFEPINEVHTDQGPIHIHAIGEARKLPGGGAESLFVIDQQISDPRRREAGETGVVLRFVHQIMQPSAGGAK